MLMAGGSVMRSGESKIILLLMVLVLVFSCDTDAQGQVLGNSITGGPGGGQLSSARGSNTLSTFNRYSTSINSTSYMNLSRQRNPLSVSGRGGATSLGISSRGIARLRSQQTVNRVPSRRLPSRRMSSNFSQMLSSGSTLTTNRSSSLNTNCTGWQGMDAIRPIVGKPPEFFKVSYEKVKLAKTQRSPSLSKSKNLSQSNSLRREKSYFDRPSSPVKFKFKR